MAILEKLHLKKEHSIEELGVLIEDIKTKDRETTGKITLRDDLILRYQKLLDQMPPEEAEPMVIEVVPEPAIETEPEKKAKENTEPETFEISGQVIDTKQVMDRRKFFKKAGKVVGAALLTTGTVGVINEVIKSEGKKKKKQETVTTTQKSATRKPAHIDSVKVETPLDTATTPKVPVDSATTEKVLDHGVEMPTNYGKIGERMDMKFYNEKLKDLSDKLAYLEWMDETAHEKDGPAYLFMVSKNRTTLTIVDRNGHPVKEAKIICGKNKGDGTEPGQTPAGYFETSRPLDPRVALSHKDRILHLDIPNTEGADLHAFTHDTINYTRPFNPGESQSEHAQNLKSSQQQAEALNSSDPNKRRLSLECVRIPGLESGVYDKYLKPVKIIENIDGEDVTFEVFPVFAISPEEIKAGKIHIIDKRGGRSKYITPEAYGQMIQKIIDKNNKMEKQGK